MILFTMSWKFKFVVINIQLFGPNFNDIGAPEGVTLFSINFSRMCIFDILMNTYVADLSGKSMSKRRKCQSIFQFKSFLIVDLFSCLLTCLIEIDTHYYKNKTWQQVQQQYYFLHWCLFLCCNYGDIANWYFLTFPTCF